INLFEPQPIEFAVDRFQCRIKTGIAFVESAKTYTDELSLVVEQPTAAAPFDRRASRLDAGRLVAVGRSDPRFHDCRITAIVAAETRHPVSAFDGGSRRSNRCRDHRSVGSNTDEGNIPFQVVADHLPGRLPYDMRPTRSTLEEFDRHRP